MVIVFVVVAAATVSSEEGVLNRWIIVRLMISGN